MYASKNIKIREARLMEQQIERNEPRITAGDCSTLVSEMG